MDKLELLSRLHKIPGNPEIRIMNTRIEDDEICPTFGIESIEVLRSFEHGEFITLQFADGDYLNEEFDIDRDN